ncbi:MAG: PadR family transcriptional regulator [bacterium]
MSVKYAILGLLHYGDMHGYRIKAHLEEHFSFMWSINYGQIYPCLKQLDGEGLIRKQAVDRNGAMERKPYSITEAGREAFARWLEGSPERTLVFRDPFLLRFVFLGFGRKERALALLDEQIRTYQRLLGRRRDNMKRWRRHGLYVKLLAELGLLFNEAFLTWLKRARKEVARNKEGVDPAELKRLFAEEGL